MRSLKVPLYSKPCRYMNINTCHWIISCGEVDVKLRRQNSFQKSIKMCHLHSIFIHYLTAYYSVFFCFSLPAVWLWGQSADEKRSPLLWHQRASETRYRVLLPAQLHSAFLLHTPGVPDSHHRSLTGRNTHRLTLKHRNCHLIMCYSYRAGQHRTSTRTK